MMHTCRSFSFISVTKLTYFSDGSGLSYDDMKSKCSSRRGRFCYFDELCPQGGPNKPPSGGQQASTDMWAPIVTSATDSSPNWVQVGKRPGGGMCIKHTVYAPVNTPDSWMVTKAVESYKKVYACCPKLKKLESPKGEVSGRKSRISVNENVRWSRVKF